MDNSKLMSVKIKTVAKALPPFSKKTTDVLPFLDLWLHGQDDRFIRKVKKIFENAAVDQRYSIMPPEEVFQSSSFEEKNNFYCQEVKKLGEECLRSALQKSSWLASDLDYIITVSCTGFMIPSLDAYLINKLRLRQDIIRLPVTEMGCAAGISGLMYAYDFLKANPGKKAALIAVEAPTATFQLNDFSMANIVSAAIFGDGAACVLLSSCPDENGPEIVDAGMYHFFDSEQLMGFNLTNSGLQMVLDIEVPEQIAVHFPAIIHPFLDKNDISIKDIDYFIFHPGGKKIIQTVEDLLKGLDKDIKQTKEILKDYGNMSSATVLYVLEKIMTEENPVQGNTGLMLSFGPGFSAQRILLKW